jgi:hypothetical protein
MCWYSDLSNVHSPTSAGIFQGAAGATGSLVIQLPAYWNTIDNCVSVDDSLLAAIAANSADYYLQIDTAAFPDGATRGQLEQQVVLLGLDVTTWVCPKGTKFPVKNEPSASGCGSIVRLADAVSPQLGMTTIGYGGAYAIDYRIQGPGVDATMDSASLMGMDYCDPGTLRCSVARMPYEWGVPMSKVTVAATAGPTGMSLAYADAFTTGVTPWSRTGAGLTLDLSSASGYTEARFFYVAKAKDTVPVEMAPDVQAGSGDASSQVPLTVTAGAMVRGNGDVHYQVAVSVDGGAYSQIATSKTPVITVNEATGHTYRFEVRAIDDRGTASDWVEGTDVTI